MAGGYTTKQIMADDFKLPKSYEELLPIYNTLAKSADQRLVRLEKLSQEDMYKNVDKWAYAKAIHEIQRLSKDDTKTVTRFNQKIQPTASGQQDYQNLLAKINAAKAFLQSPTSTKSGIISVYKKRADIINKKYGTSFSWQSLAKYYQSGLADKLARFGYETALITIGEIAKSKKYLKSQAESIQEAEKKIENGNKDEVLSAKSKEIVDKYGAEIEEILK